ncbi:type VII secretion system-associated protein [Saccharopolyspora sp. NPDC049426]|uniref:type VII secretion system-associated protein n=1 Tax=Saccharopolyspora sp. NPDC049426 TaxID=3155652 RepID=UPI0034449C7C
MTEPTPPITDEMRAHAKENPNTWLYIADPGYAQDDEGDMPPEGVVGAYRIDENGVIDEEFQFNEQYVPSDLMLHRPEPSNDLERVLDEIADGERPEDDLPQAVLDGEVMLYAPSAEDRNVYTAEMSDGTTLVPACTSPSRVPEDWPGYRTVPGSWLPDVLGGYDLGLNLHEAVQAVIPNGVLVQFAEDQGE